jgi:hypothetical protein
MRRRELITLLGGAAAWPLPARAQQARKIHTIGYLSPAVPSAYAASFFDALSELGWVEGQNIAVERRFAENRLERLPELAGELVRHATRSATVSRRSDPSSLAARGRYGKSSVFVLRFEDR